MQITGDFRPGSEFSFDCPPGNMSQASFITVFDEQVFVTRRATELFCLPDGCAVIANWHGQRRTDAFAMTIGDLKAHAAKFAR